MNKIKKVFSVILCTSIIIACFAGLSAKAVDSVDSQKVSSNANLASIKLSDGTLSPAFDSNTTNYDVTVKYSVDKITITGSVADGGSIYTGGGTFDLKVGDNSRVLTVTAADGTKKSYTINIKRMTEQETKDAEDDERNANPLLVKIGGKDYTIVNDAEKITVPKGFELGTAERKGEEIAVLNDQHGKYQLFWLVDENGENGAFYTRDNNDKFTRINCINIGGKVYIIEPLDIEGVLPAGYVESDRTIDGVELDVYGFTNPNLKDFYIVKCYIDGKTGYYCFDSVEVTMQRAVIFELAVKEANSAPDEDTEETNVNGKSETMVLLFVLLAAILIIIAAVVIIIIVASNKKRYDDDDFLSIAEGDPLLNDLSGQEDNEKK